MLEPDRGGPPCSRGGSPMSPTWRFPGLGSPGSRPWADRPTARPQRRATAGGVSVGSRTGGRKGSPVGSPIVFPRHHLLERDVQDDKEVTAPHLLHLEARLAVMALPPADRERLVAVPSHHCFQRQLHREVECGGRQWAAAIDHVDALKTFVTSLLRRPKRTFMNQLATRFTSSLKRG